MQRPFTFTCSTKSRRAATTVQVAIVLVAVTFAVVIGVSQVGTQSSTHLAQTATDVGNPNSLVGRFGNTSSSSGSGSESSGSSSGSSSSGSSGSSGTATGGSSSGSSGSSGSVCP